MNTKTYSVRVPQSAPDLDSEQVSTWLDAQHGSTESLAPDPGAGPKVLRLTLDREKVEQSAKAAGESEAVFLRRLISSRAEVKPEPREAQTGKEVEEKPRPRPIVLPARLRLTAEQLGPAVAAYDHFQAFAISRAMRTPEAAAVARLTEEERAQLSSATAELTNRRAPTWLIENIDLFGLGSLLISIEFKKIDAAREVAEKARAKQAPKKTGMTDSNAGGGFDVVPR